MGDVQALDLHGAPDVLVERPAGIAGDPVRALVRDQVRRAPRLVAELAGQAGDHLRALLVRRLAAPAVGSTYGRVGSATHQPGVPGRVARVDHGAVGVSTDGLEVVVREARPGTDCAPPLP